jgi:hypothetical protein
MTTAEHLDELDQYVAARQVLARVQTELDDPDRWGDVLHPADLPPDRLDNLVGTLCQQARAAQQLASAAESLCAALVADRYHHRRGDVARASHAGDRRTADPSIPRREVDEYR